MSDHAQPDHASGAKDPEITGTSQKIWPLFKMIWMIILAIFLVWGVRGCAATDREEKALAKKAEARQEASYTAASTPTTETLPAVIYATTPATLTLDYAFNIETEQEILVKYPGEKAILYNGKCQKLPQPERYGPKVFTDPKDEVNGHVPFRIYPIRIGDIPPCT
ncbi:MAG: hypothetical protein Q8P52_01110 [bacterium]|nr:hypothetical protein [bacterium]